MAANNETVKAKRGSWRCSKGHSTGGRASVCKVCGEPKPLKKAKGGANIDQLLKLISEIGGVGTLKQLVSEAKNIQEKLSPFGGVVGAEQAITAFYALEKAVQDAAK